MFFLFFLFLLCIILANSQIVNQTYEFIPGGTPCSNLTFIKFNAPYVQEFCCHQTANFVAPFEVTALDNVIQITGEPL